VILTITSNFCSNACGIQLVYSNILPIPSRWMGISIPNSFEMGASIPYPFVMGVDMVNGSRYPAATLSRKSLFMGRKPLLSFNGSSQAGWTQVSATPRDHVAEDWCAPRTARERKLGPDPLSNCSKNTCFKSDMFQVSSKAFQYSQKYLCVQEKFDNKILLDNLERF